MSIEQLEQLVADEPENSDAWFDLGDAYADDDRHEQAVAAYYAVIRLEQSCASAYFNLGNAYRKLRQYEDALEAYRQADLLAPDDAATLYYIGQCFYHLSRYQDASESLERATLLDPSDWYSFYALGNVFAEQERYVEACSAFKRAAEIDPEEADAYNQLGQTYEFLEDYDNAINAYQQARRLTKNDPSPIFHLGRVYDWLGQNDLALAYYQQAVRLDPAYNIPLGALYQRLSRLQEAAEIFCAVIDAEPDNGNAYNMLTAEEYPDRFESAVETLLLAKSLRPNAWPIEYSLGMAYDELNRTDDAIAAFCRTVIMNPTHIGARVQFGDCLRKAERYDEALQVFQEIIQIRPASDTAYRKMGITLCRIGDHEGAAKA
ncbi:MAG TPA: tetratricopeptide repeat protein, partial [Armatimonadota bacterium]